MFYVRNRQSFRRPGNSSCPEPPSEVRLSGFFLSCALWSHHSCKLSLCNGEAVVLAPRWASVFLLHPKMSIPIIISHLCVIFVPRSDQHVTVSKDVTPLKPAEGESLVSRSNVVGVSFDTPPSETPSDEYNEHNLQDVILILYLSAFVCKLSIMEKKKHACICSWFCHEMTLPNVWYCFLYLKGKKIHDCGCSKIML